MELLNDSVPPVPPGEPVLGRYRLHHEIASGGMASVYLASVDSKEGFNKLVALKRIHGHLAKDPEFVEMFLDEARIAARIEHPNVCSVFDFGQVGDDYFIAMEYLMGETVRALLREEARRTRHDGWAPLAANLVAQACEGLHAAHELRGNDGAKLGLVHRDVSPQNLFVTYGGCLKVVDFGIARAEGKSHHTTPGTIKGKFSYIAPEQLTGSSEVDRRADVWSLGVTLWEMLALRPLFRREGAIETLTAVVNDPIPPPSSVRPDLPPALDAIVLRALMRRREDRYATAREMGRDLAAYCREARSIGAVEVEEHMDLLFSEEKSKKLVVAQWIRETSVIRRKRDDRASRTDDEETASIVLDRTPSVRFEVPAPARTHAARRFRIALAGLVALAFAAPVAWRFLGGAAREDARTPSGAQVTIRDDVPAAPKSDPPADAPPPLASALDVAERDEVHAKARVTGRSDRRDRARTSSMRASAVLVSRADAPAPPGAEGSTIVAAAAETASFAPAPALAAPAPSAAAASDTAPSRPPAAAVATSTPASANAAASPPRPAPPPASASAASSGATAAREPPRQALEAAASVRGLDARGSLPSSTVQRAVARHQGRLRQCYAEAARRAGRDAASTVAVSLVIDEMGAARSVSATGGALPGLSECVASAYRGLRTSARPDVGRVNVRFEVRFAPRGSGG